MYSDYEQWYKKNFPGQQFNGNAFSSLTKPEDMSNDEWEKGQRLYEEYIFDKNHASEFEDLDRNRGASQQMASINYEKLKKYLPVQLKAQGLSGLGMSESAMLEAGAKYANDMTDIENDYWTQKNIRKNEIYDKNYENAPTIIDTSRFSDKDEMSNYIKDTFKGEVRDTDYQNLLTYGESVVEKNQKQNFEDAKEYIKNHTFKIEDELNNYLEGIEKSMSPTDYNIIEDYARDIKAARDFAGIQTAGDLKDNSIGFNLNGTDMNVGFKAGVYDDIGSTIYAKEHRVSNNSFFLYNDDVYFYRNGTAYRVGATSTKEQDRKEFNLLKHYLMTGVVLSDDQVTA